MSGPVRWLVSLVVVVLVVGVGVVAYRHGGSSDDQARQTSGTTAAGGTKSTVRNPDPDLARMKTRFGIPDCAPGTGGGQLPAVTLSCLGGGTPVDLSTLRGPMILNVWASWCGPCAKEMPALAAFDRDHGTRVPVLGIDFEDQYSASALDTMRDRGVHYPSLADPDGVLLDRSVFPGLTHVPILVFLDRDGKVAFVHPGGVESESEVSDLARQHLGVDL